MLNAPQDMNIVYINTSKICTDQGGFTRAKSATTTFIINNNIEKYLEPNTQFKIMVVNFNESFTSFKKHTTIRDVKLKG